MMTPHWARMAVVGDRQAGAVFGERGPADIYRYVLWREFNTDLFMVPRTVGFVMLNPSTANHTKNDPTISRCIDFSRRWGFTKLIVCNLFALRSTSPKLLPQHGSPVGPLNDELIARYLGQCERVICAWGNDGVLHQRCDRVLELIRSVGLSPYALEVTQKRQPNHPLYLRADTMPTLFHHAPVQVAGRVPGEEG